MNTWKKLVSCLLVLSMIASMIVVVTAEEADQPEASTESVTYSNCTDINGNPLNAKVVSGIQWVEENGAVKMPAGPENSLLLFDNALETNRIEATIVVRDNINGDGNHRNGIAFALTDHDGDLDFKYSATDVSYYWAFINDWGGLGFMEMGKFGNWGAGFSMPSVDLAAYGIDVSKGVTIAAEWDAEGNIKVFANDRIMMSGKDETPLTGTLYGMAVNKWGNTQTPNTYNAPVTSFVAGKAPATVPENYDICVDASGNLLNPYFVNGHYWKVWNDQLKMPEGVENSFLLFDTPLATNRVEATIFVNDLGRGDNNHRNGLVFALTDHDGDRTFTSSGSDVSYYWAFINDWGCVEVIEMGAYQNWHWLTTSGVDLATLGIDVTKGVTLAAEWDAAGNIKVYANGKLVQDITDESPLEGTLYGMLVNKWGNTQVPNNYNAPVTSFVAGGVLKPEYDNCVDANGNPLNVNVVNGVTWIEENGMIKMPAGYENSFILFDNELETKRIEAKIFINDLGNGDGNHRNGLVFALDDIDGDRNFTYAATDVSYYWAFINDWGTLAIWEMGANGSWGSEFSSGTSVDLKGKFGIDVSKGVDLAVEWDDNGHIKAFANGYLVFDVVDPTPLKGDLYGMLVNKWGNTQVPNNYNAPVASFVAGGALATPDMEISVAVDPTDAGTVTGAGNYYLGADVTLTVTPKAGYNFVGWYENGEFVSADAAYTFMATADRNLTATFTTITYTITVTPAENGTVTGGGTFGEGTEVTVTATPNAGYKFVAWLSGETEVSTNATYTFEATEDCTLTAKFEKVTYSVAVDAENNLLNPYFVNGVTWVEEDGKLKMPFGNEQSFLLFDTPLANNRVEATLVINDTGIWGDGNRRNGIVFALTDSVGDGAFLLWDTDISYYWAFVDDWNCLHVYEMSAAQQWADLTTIVDLPSIGVDVKQGVTIAAEWDAQGHIKVFANGILAMDFVDETPLAGNLYGLLVNNYGNFDAAYGPYDSPVTSFVAGGTSATPNTEVNVTVDPTEGGAVEGAGNYYLGTTATLTATANDGYKFVGWYENGEFVSAEATIAFKVTANRALTAKFISLDDYQQVVMDNAETNAGEEVVVTLLIKNNPGIAGLVVTLKYDESVLTLIDAVNGELFSGFDSALNILWDESFNVTEDGILVTLTFAVAEGAEAGDYTVEVIVRECIDINGDAVDIMAVNGTITVTEAAEEEIMYGDANGDGIINMKDIATLTVYIADYDEETGTSSINVGLGADANGDGVINMKDIATLTVYIADYDEETGTSSIVLGPKQ